MGPFDRAWRVLKNYTGQACARCNQPIGDIGSNAELLAGIRGMCLSCYVEDKYGM